MSRDKGVGLGLLALLPIACCAGIPLLAAAGIGLAALAWGGAALGIAAAVGVVSFLWLRRRRRCRACALAGQARPAPRKEILER